MKYSPTLILTVALSADCGARIGLESSVPPTTPPSTTTSIIATGGQTGGAPATSTGGISQLGTGGTSQDGTGGVRGTTSGESAEWCDIHAGNDGGGGAHTVAFRACCQCGWPVDGAECQYVLKILPFCHGADDTFYYSCIGGEVPFCILDHLASCAHGFPPECVDAYAAQVECLAKAGGGT